MLRGVKNVDWSEVAERGLAVSAGNDMAAIRHEVKQGIAVLWRVDGDGVDGYVVTRVEPGELVIVCGEGKGFHHIVPFFLTLARRSNLTVRTHIKRRGLLKMWARHGVTLDEYVLRG